MLERMATPDKQQQALRDLARRRANGEMHVEAYEANRAKLLAKANRRPVPLWVKLMVYPAAFALALWVLGIVLNNMDAML